MTFERVFLIAAMACLLGSDGGPPDITKEGSTRNPPPAYTDGKLDLFAQQSMADSARWMLILTALQVVVGVIGTVVIIQSLAISRRAIGQTSDVLEHQKDTAKRELRAYLTVDFHSMFTEARSEGFRVVFTVVNKGQTPARKVIADIGAFGIRGNPGEMPVDPAWARIDPVSVKDLGPDVGATAFIEWAAPEMASVKRLIDEGGQLLVWITVNYEDAFGEVQWIRYSAFLSGWPLTLNRENPAFMGGS